MKNKAYLSICCAVNYLVAGLNFDGAITEIIFGRDLFWITGSFIFFALCLIAAIVLHIKLLKGGEK